VDSEHYRVNTPSVICETIDGEAVIIDLQSGTYYSLRDSAALVWDALLSGATVSDVLARVAATDATLADAVHAFVQELVDEKLLVECPPPADAAPPTTLDALGSAIDPPILERFTDMQELILLDPVHDVDAEEGWPKAKRPAQEAGGAG